MAQMFLIIAQFLLVFRQNWRKYTRLFRFQALKWGTVPLCIYPESRDIGKNVQNIYFQFYTFCKKNCKNVVFRFAKLLILFFYKCCLEYQVSNFFLVPNNFTFFSWPTQTPFKGSNVKDFVNIINLSRKLFISVSKNMSKNC